MLNNGQRQADASADWQAALKYGYLKEKEKVSFAESLGYRTVTESSSGQGRRLEPPARA